jgi:hypothetical protein
MQAKKLIWDFLEFFRVRVVVTPPKLDITAEHHRNLGLGLKV